MILKPTAMVLGESAQRMETVQYTTQDLALCEELSRQRVKLGVNWATAVPMR
jgi:hypothetical protein